MRLKTIFIALVAAMLSLSAAAENSLWYGHGRLDWDDPTFKQAQWVDAQCVVAQDYVVPYDVHELILYTNHASGYAEITAQTCDTTDFDTIILFYMNQPPSGPGAFDPLNPCQNLVASANDECGLQSILGEYTARGRGAHLDVVVTTPNPKAVGDDAWYDVLIWSQLMKLGEFIFYSGFEQGQSWTWSIVMGMEP